MKTKRTFFALCACFLALFLCTSCSDDDDKLGSEDNLIGTWECVRDSGYQIEDGEKESYDESYASGRGDRLIFGADGSLIIEGEEGRYSYSKGKLTISYTEEDGERFSQQLNVVKLTASTLILDFHYKEPGYEEYMKSEYKKIK